MSKAPFGVFNTMSGETIAEIWMDIELVKDPEIVNPESMTLSPIANGSKYTLLPLDDGRLTALKRLRAAYLTITEKPAHFFSTSISRVDTLIKAVGGVFDEIKYIVVNNKEDLNFVINPHADHEFETTSISVLGDLTSEIVGEDQELVEEDS